MSEKHIKTCCCLAKGTSKLGSTFQKNIFFPHEEIKGAITIDNSHCTIDCKNVHFAVETQLTFHIPALFGSHHHHMIERDLIQENTKGPCAGEGDWSKEMCVDLRHIPMPELTDRKSKKGGRKPLSPEDLFLVRGLQSACHGSFFRMEYFLVAETTYDGCTCCAELPHSRMPISILPIVNPDCFGFKAPEGWNPTYHGSWMCVAHRI